MNKLILIGISPILFMGIVIIPLFFISFLTFGHFNGLYYIGEFFETDLIWYFVCLQWIGIIPLMIGLYQERDVLREI